MHTPVMRRYSIFQIKSKIMTTTSRQMLNGSSDDTVLNKLWSKCTMEK